MQDKVVKGRMRGNWTKGNSFGTKLTELEVIEIRADPRNNQEIADAYDVSRPLVSLIKRRKIWTHV